MGTGKYSPFCQNVNDLDKFHFTCYGEVPADWNQQIQDSGVEYDTKTMFGGYDDEGFDSYGYSAFNAAGKFVGHGSGIDRYGYTEDDYLLDSIDGGDLYDDVSVQHTSFVRDK